MSDNSSNASIELALGLRFKGDRAYIQGGDIFSAVTRVGGQLTGLRDPHVTRISFTHFARNECVVGLVQPDSSLIGHGTLTSANQEKHFYIRETQIPASGRYAFDEAALISRSRIEGRSIVMDSKTEHSTIEEIIALTKELNYRLMPDIPGKWVFGKIDLKRALPEDHARLLVRMRSAVSGRFSVNDIEIGGDKVGTIQFIVGNP